MGGFGTLMQGAEFVTGLYGVYEQSQFDEKARQEAIARWEKSVGMADQLKGRVLPSVAKLGREQMSMLEGSGVQQKKDVRRRAATRLAGVQSNLQSRGLGNTTIGASMTKGFGEFEEDQLARVDEQVRQERMQTHGYWGLLGNQLDVDLTGQQIGIQAGRQIPPQQSAWLGYSEQFGRQRPAPEAPEAPGTDVLTPAIGGVATLGAAKIIVLACIDGDAMLETVDGRVSLAEVQIGDEVLSANGTHQEVVNKDYGMPYASRSNDFIKITLDENSLILTKDHIVAGKPAAYWPHEQADRVHCGDIHLEDGSDYIANGFGVSTMPELIESTRSNNASSIHTARSG